MNKIDKIRNEIVKDVSKNFKRNKKKLISSFVESFGSEYADIIQNRIDNMTFICYMSDKEIENIVNNSQNKNQMLLYYLKLFYQEKEQSGQDSAYNRIIYCSDNSIIDNNFIINMEKTYKNIKTNTDALLYKDGKYKTLVLFSPLVNDNSIIHEIVHALGNEILFEYVGKNGFNRCNRQGFNIVCGNEKNIINEIITQWVADEVSCIFARKNGRLINGTPIHLEISSLYRNDYHLINSFYNIFNKEIKEVIIKGNLNLLKEYCKKNKYEDYLKLVQRLYSLEKKDNATIKKESIAINDIVNKMKMNKNGQERLSNKELLKEFKKENPRVRIRKI